MITDLTSGFGNINNFGQLLVDLRTEVLKDKKKISSKEIIDTGFNFQSEFPPLDLTKINYKNYQLVYQKLQFWLVLVKSHLGVIK